MVTELASELRTVLAREYQDTVPNSPLRTIAIDDWLPGDSTDSPDCRLAIIIADEGDIQLYVSKVPDDDLRAWLVEDVADPVDPQDYWGLTGPHFIRNLTADRGHEFLRAFARKVERMAIQPPANCDVGRPVFVRLARSLKRLDKCLERFNAHSREKQANSPATMHLRLQRFDHYNDE